MVLPTSTGTPPGQKGYFYDSAVMARARIVIISILLFHWLCEYHFMAELNISNLMRITTFK